MYWHPQYKALLVVYVDDFKLAAKCKNIAWLWKQLRAKILLDDPTPPERFLGCYTHRFECGVQEMLPILVNQPELVVRVPVKVPERSGTITRGKNKNKSKKLTKGPPLVSSADTSKKFTKGKPMAAS